MKSIICILFLNCYVLHVFSQEQLISLWHMIRENDVISKQQVDYKEPGRSGANVLWDFSQLEEVNPGYILEYKSPDIYNSNYIIGNDTIPMKDLRSSEKFVVGEEHYTKYFYHFYNDTLFCLGHKNPVSQLWYSTPLLVGIFPTVYQEKIILPYKGEGTYSMQVPVRVEGTSTIEQDAYGMMILPSGDTLKHVSRIKTVQIILDKAEVSKSLNPPMNIEMETFRWYVEGYRYPIFETVCSYNIHGDNRNRNFATAFFYPVEEAYYDEMAIKNEPNNENNKLEDGGLDLWDRLSYNIFPNPASACLNIELYVPQKVDIALTFSSMNGTPLYKKSFSDYSQGVFRHQFDLTEYIRGNYILTIQLGDHVVNEKIIKL